MNNVVAIISALLYLLLLFGVAYFAEHKRRKGHSIINNGYVYALSLTVYCTAWTYYGSVGRASTNGLDFLAIYLGPTIGAVLFLPVLNKILTICKTQHINSIADLISTRYGKNFSLAAIVTILCVLGIIPYIALQLKAISTSMHVLTARTGPETSLFHFLQDDTFYITIALSVFIILFGTRSIDASEKHEGLVAAVAFESIIKLVAFLAAGFFIVYGIFHGFGDIFSQAAANENLAHLFTLSNNTSYATWFGLMIISMLAIVFLPRQFQVGVVENIDANHLKKATWMFPLYLLLINIFVFPIALAGKLIFSGVAIDADTFVLALPLHFGQNILGLIIFIGGFSAATSMIIVETIALTTMISNNLVLPFFLRTREFLDNKDGAASKRILTIRRVSIIIILALTYLYNKTIAQHLSLVSIGLVSFVAVAQFAPAVLGGMYWKTATKAGAIAGIIAGFIIWFFTLVIPSLVSANIIGQSVMEHGLFGIELLKPFSLFGSEGMDSIVHAAFWSLLVNTVLYLFVSLNTKQTAQEAYQAEIFVDIEKHNQGGEGSTVWKGTAYLPDISSLLENFLGTERAKKLIANYAQRHKISLTTGKADARLVTFVENILSGVIGSASARIMVQSVTKEEELKIDEVLNILRESQQMMELNKELRKKSTELQKATTQLQEVNAQLKQMDEMKDEFLYTVTHELRTPITSLRAMAEIIHDHPDLEEEERQEFLSGMIKETARISHLITQVLNLERYESGRQKLERTTTDLTVLIKETADAVRPLILEKNIDLKLFVPDSQVIMNCDKDMVQQVLYNLLTNAVKFVNANEGKILVRLQADELEAKVYVEDNGKGIPAEERELIFDKFFQARNQTIKKPQGSGLGLAISKKIVEMHGGMIWVEDTHGNGSRFIFTLPI